MYRNVIVCVAALMVLGACSVPKRTGPPAPIVSAPGPSRGPTTAPGERDEPVGATASVYPYEAPSTLAEAPPGGAGEGSASAVDPGPPREDDSMPGSDTELAYAEDRTETPTLSPAADGLLRKAEQQRQSRDYPGAAASLERALRIAPQSGFLWNRLARVRLEQGLYTQAQNLAARSNALAGDDASLKRDNWSVIAVARRRTGDTAGAAEAERYARGG